MSGRSERVWLLARSKVMDLSEPCLLPLLQASLKSERSEVPIAYTRQQHDYAGSGCARYSPKDCLTRKTGYNLFNEVIAVEH